MGIRPAVLLLAAGNARRFGENKLLLPLGKYPVVEHVMRALGGAEAADCVLVTQNPEIEQLGWLYGFHAVRNPYPEAGISSSIRLGIAALCARTRHLPGCLFAVGDQPWLRPESVRGLVEAWRESPAHILAMAHAGERGNPVIFPKDLFPELLALRGDVGGGAVIRANPERLRLYEIDDPRELRDVDTPEDWKECNP